MKAGNAQKFLLQLKEEENVTAPWGILAPSPLLRLSLLSSPHQQDVGENIQQGLTATVEHFQVRMFERVKAAPLVSSKELHSLQRSALFKVTQSNSRPCCSTMIA